jgi:hypothetical protein
MGGAQLTTDAAVCLDTSSLSLLLFGGGDNKGGRPPPAGHTHNSRGCRGPRSSLTEVPSAWTNLNQCMGVNQYTPSRPAVRSRDGLAAVAFVCHAHVESLTLHTAVYCCAAPAVVTTT